jgi:amino acid transporter
MADLYLSTLGVKKLNEKKGFMKREKFVDVSNISGIVSLAMAVIAGYLAWTKNERENMVMRLIITLVAAMFATLYLIYYVIYYQMMNGQVKLFMPMMGGIGAYGGLFGGRRRRKSSKKAKKSHRKSKKRSKKSHRRTK